MAYFKHKNTGGLIVLRPHHVFGNQKSAENTYCAGKSVSKIHAVVYWKYSNWYIVDHSRCGCFVNDRKVEPSKEISLRVGDTVRFGNSIDAEWVVADLSKPRPQIVELTPINNNCIPLNKSNLLGDGGLVYLSDSGNWVYENQGYIQVLRNNEVFGSGLFKWMLTYLVEESDVLPEERSKYLFVFSLSLDEEHVSVLVRHGEKEIQLGERTHHYLLLNLARVRVDDCNNSVSSDEQGWLDMEELSKMLQLDCSHLNVQIYRIRKQLSEFFPKDSEVLSVVERRQGCIRFGDFGVKIIQNSKVLCDKYGFGGKQNVALN